MPRCVGWAPEGCRAVQARAEDGPQQRRSRLGLAWRQSRLLGPRSRGGLRRLVRHPAPTLSVAGRRQRKASGAPESEVRLG